jgi:hypothetical protein
MDTNRFHVEVRDGEVVFTPHVRPGEWRALPAGALDAWLAKQYRELALQPASVVPMSAEPNTKECAA